MLGRCVAWGGAIAVVNLIDERELAVQTHQDVIGLVSF